MAERSGLAILALALAAGCASERSARHEVEAVVRAQEAAWNSGDVAGYMRAGYWQSEGLTFFSQGDVTRGYGPVLARYTERYASNGAEMGHLDFKDLETVVLGSDAALVRGRWHVDFEKKDDAGGLFTLILRKSPNGWRIVHDHTSVAAN